MTTEWANPTYDGVWSLALAMNNSIPKLTEIGLSLSDYNYGHPDVTDIIRDEVVGLQFQGASGHISFNNKTGYTNSTVDLHQLVDNVSVLVGVYSEDTEMLEIVDKSAEFVENSFDSEELLVHPALASFFLLFTAIALVLIITAHVLTLVYRNFSAIRASSYRLGQLIFIGCYVVTLSIICFTVQKAAPTSSVNITSLCVIQAWCLPLGFTLILGTVTAKTWRLYRIFVHLKKPGKLLTDWVLIIVVLLLVGVDVILLVIWTAVFPFNTLHRETTTGANRIKVQAECNSDYYFVWFGTLVAYQGLIMMTAFALALLTKKIRHESFKTKAVTILVYFLTITLLLGMPTYIILQTTNTSGVNAEYTVLALTLNLVLYLCFVFLFFPPILSLLRVKLFPKLPGLKKFSKDTNTNSYQPSSFVTKH
jgi:gamma-aminobutyric acid type B receptor